MTNTKLVQEAKEILRGIPQVRINTTGYRVFPTVSNVTLSTEKKHHVLRINSTHQNIYTIKVKLDEVYKLKTIHNRLMHHYFGGDNIE